MNEGQFGKRENEIEKKKKNKNKTKFRLTLRNKARCDHDRSMRIEQFKEGEWITLAPKESKRRGSHTSSNTPPAKSPVWIRCGMLHPLSRELH